MFPIQLRRGLESGIDTVQALEGEILYCTDTGNIFIGQGVNKKPKKHTPPTQSVGKLELKDASVRPNHLDLSTQSNVLATKNTNQTFLASVWTRIDYNTVNRDTQSEFNITNNQFIPKSNGLYSLSISNDVGFTKAKTDVLIQIAIYKNGSLFDIGISDYKSVSKDWHNTMLFENKIQLSAGDILEVFFYTNNKDAYIYGTTQTFFKAVKIL